MQFALTSAWAPFILKTRKMKEVSSMEESMRILIAYAELIIGVPLLFAKIFWFIPSVILAKVLSHVARGIDQILDAAVEGFIAIVFACVVFDQLSLQIASVVPIILIVVNSLWEWVKESSPKAWSSAVGIIAGFTLYRHGLLLLVNEFVLSM
jgi:hypothetical protein